jgi:hypothetical protein
MDDVLCHQFTHMTDAREGFYKDGFCKFNFI